MKVTQEKLPDSQIGIEIEIPAEASKKVYENVVKKLTKSVNIPGFRRGKVPRKIVIQRLGESYIKATALEELIDSSIKTAIQQEDIPVLGNLSLRSDMEQLISVFTPDQSVTVSVAADVYPEAEYEPDSYKTITVQAEEIKFSPDSVDKWLEEERNKRATLVPVEDRPAAMGDQVIVDYQAYEIEEDGSQGAAIAEVTGKDFEVQMEEGRLVEGLVEGIVGMKIEETKAIPVTFPEDYPLETVAGKSVTFDITVKEIKAKELPDLDDDFAEEASEFETLAELRQHLETVFQEQTQERTKKNIHEAIKKGLAEISTTAMPVTMIEQECERLVRKTILDLEQMGLNVNQMFQGGDDMMTMLKQNARPEAIAELKTQLMMSEIAEKESIESTDEEIETEVQKLKKEFAGQKIDDEQLLNYVKVTLKEGKVLDWLQEIATIELVPEGTLSQQEEEASEENNEEGEENESISSVTAEVEETD